MIKIDEDDPVGELEQSFPYRDVKIRRGVDLKEFYDLQSEIGRGKFGTVYKCKEKATGLLLAAKIVNTARKEDKRNVEREIDIMQTLQHPRLIQLYDAFDKDKSMIVVLELIEGGELFERVIGDDFVLTEKSCTAFMRQICEGMEFIHQKNILHLDMKPENILCLTKTGNRIKIIDFGLARKFDPDKKLQVLFGTPEFVAPEVVNFDRIGFGTDMWSIGVICYVLLSGLSPFMGDTDIETMANVTIAKWDFDDEAFADISDNAKDFISNLLVKDKEKRLSATQCLSHPWLRRKLPVPVEKTPSIAKVDVSRSELDLAKDNLKFFVERWNEHPNSPYIFDTSCQTISPCVSFNNIPERRSRTPSLSGYSPSPCESISLCDGEMLPDSPPMSPRKSLPGNCYLKTCEGSPRSSSPINHYLDRLQLFDRRASDSSCLIRHPVDVVSRINLAEQIKKLSDKLLKINAPQNYNGSNNSSTEEYAFTYDVGNRKDNYVVRTTTKVVKNFSDPVSTIFYTTTSSARSTTYQTSPKQPPTKHFNSTNHDHPLPKSAPTTPEWETLSDTSSTLSSPTPGHSNPSTPDLFPETPEQPKNLLYLFPKYDHVTPKMDRRRTSLSITWSEVESLAQRTIKSLSHNLQTSPRNAPSTPNPSPSESSLSPPAKSTRTTLATTAAATTTTTTTT